MKSNLEFFSDGQQAKRLGRSVVTIGAFDGVHLGHQQLLKQLCDSAKQLGLPSVVVVFEPQPNEYFKPKKAPARLMRLREKVLALRDFGVDSVLCLRFNQRLREMTAEAFIHEVLVESLGVRKLIVGDDFRFGNDRSGDFEMLSAAGRSLNFDVVDTQTLYTDSERVSSTYIRKLLSEGELSDAEALLGRRYSNIGRVVYGKRLGRQLGFPTMNVQLGRLNVPLRGVFAVDIELNGHTLNSPTYQGVANVGVRPTINEVMKPVLEAHAFDVNIDAYGKCIRITYRKKIRDEQRFENVQALTAQIKHDAASARAFFNANAG